MSEPANPLCGDGRLKEIYQQGHRIEKRLAGSASDPGWDKFIGGGHHGKNYVHYAGCHATALLADSVAQHLRQEDIKISDMQASLHGTLQQLVKGEVPEFNAVVDRIVREQIEQVLKPQLQEQEIREREAPIFVSLNQLTTQAFQVSEEEIDVAKRVAQLKEILAQMQEQGKALDPLRPANEAVLRMITLVKILLNRSKADSE